MATAHQDRIISSPSSPHSTTAAADSADSLSMSAVDTEKPSNSDNSKNQHLPVNNERTILSNPSRIATSASLSRDVTGHWGSVGSSDHNAVYQPSSYSPQAQTFYYGGFDNTTGEWGEYSQYVTSENMEIGSPGIYNDSPSLVFHTGYGYNPQMPYGPYSPVTTPLSSVRGDGQLYSAQQYPISGGASYYQQLVPSNIPYANSLNSVSQTDMPAPVSTDHQGEGMLFGPRPGYSPQFGSFGRGSSSFHGNSDGQRSFAPLSPAVSPQPGNMHGSFGRNVGMASLLQRPLYGLGYGSSSHTRRYPHNGVYQSGFDTASFSTLGANDCWITLDKVRRRARDSGPLCSCNGVLDILSEQNRGPRASKPKNQGTTEHSSSVGLNNTPIVEGRNHSYNRQDFATEYNDGKFFVIKSYSEDNVHKSIKYGVWASTANGNKKLDAAYHEAKERQCPVFLLFSVNASAQFCGVAEMIGSVDFDKSVDYWQQDKWSGQFPVKWYIIKDVPNSQFRHIILENNDSKPVTNSRDTQEVKFEQGLEMLNIFKNFETNLSILDDFDYYEEREKALQERKARQQANNIPTSMIGGNEYRNPVTLTNDIVKQMSISFAEAVRLEESSKERLMEKSESASVAIVGNLAKPEDTNKTTVVSMTQNS